MVPNDAVRFETGRALEDWGPLKGDLESGTPHEHGHLYIDDKARGLTAGLWHCTPMTAKMGPYPVDEFMLLLEGAVEMVTPDGAVTRVEAGEAFVLPKGLVCQWRQPGPVKKIFVILETPDDAAARPAEGLSVIKVDPAAAMQKIASPPADSLLSGTPACHGRELFADATGKLSVGLWDATAYHRKAMPFPRHELMCLLEGEVAVAGPGAPQTFRGGESFFVPQGAVTDFQVRDYVKKIYVILKP